MVKRAGKTGAKGPAQGKPRKSALRKKLWRDMRAAAMQFLAIVALCALGTWVYAGLDGGWRMIQRSYDAYFAECNLADLWVNAAVGKADLDSLRNLRGVAAVQARITVEVDCPDQGDDVSLRLHAYDGDAAVCRPYLLEGALLKSGDRRGVLLEKQFADAYGLTEGSEIRLRIHDTDMPFTVRGLVISAEEMLLSKDISPDPAHFSFAVVTAEAVPFLPFNEALLDLADDADADAVERDVQAMLPEALLLDRHTQASAQRADTMVTIFRTLSYVFPAMAFAVAAMVVLSTLTRMIENQRLQMGALKALGYDDGRIRRHYLNYALIPSLFGALLGLLTGRYTLPDILYNMETAHYIMPNKLRAPISVSAWCVTGLMVALSLSICLYTYQRAAGETTASLLRPNPPKAGSRVALERCKRLWAGFSFNTKMMLRNIARNKGRTMMSLLGLLCCNMLIICAMGLQNSIDTNIEQYYGGVLAYDVRAELSPSDAGTLDAYRRRLDADRIEGVMEKSVSLRHGDVSRTTALTVVEAGQTLLHLGPGQQLAALPPDGLTLTQKLSEVLGLSIGDTAEIWLPNETEPVLLPVCAIAPVSMGQAAYLSEPLWDSLQKGAFRPTALLLRGPTALSIHTLTEDDAVTELRYTADQLAAGLDMMDSTKAVFSVMYIAAIGLAFVICYNMSLMNFTERTRDYATLKVLGYHQREIRGLMMHENDIVTAAGTLLGVGPGLLLTRVVLATVNSETMVWTTHVAPLSVLIASVITAAFSVLLEWLVTRKVPGIDMVEALKSVE